MGEAGVTFALSLAAFAKKYFILSLTPMGCNRALQYACHTLDHSWPNHGKIHGKPHLDLKIATWMHFHLELLHKKNQNIPSAGKVASKSHRWSIKRWTKRNYDEKSLARKGTGVS
jgi:hypothetical protein